MWDFETCLNFCIRYRTVTAVFSVSVAIFVSIARRNDNA